MADPSHAVVLDLDGTLVDSVHHHVIAWHAALARHGFEVPTARVHAAVGMGGARLVRWLTGRPSVDVEPIADDHLRAFRELADTLHPTVGAVELLADLTARDVPHAVATSSGPEERDLLLQALPASPDVVDSADVHRSKPSPDLLLQACRHLDIEPSDATMVGDSPWDAHAAARAAMPCLLVRSGGFGEDALRSAGPRRIVDSPRELIGQL